MSSVRDRITGEQYAAARQAQDAQRAKEAAYKATKDADDDFVRPIAQTARPQAGAVTSVRARTERAQAQESEETLTPIDKHRATGMTSAHTGCTSVRGRIEAAQVQAEVQSGHPVSAAAQMYLEAEERERKLRAEGEARRAVEQAELRARNEAREKENARIIAIRLELDGWRASEAERKKVWELFNRPGSITPEEVCSVIVELRDTLGGPRPEWAF